MGMEASFGNNVGSGPAKVAPSAQEVVKVKLSPEEAEKEKARLKGEIANIDKQIETEETNLQSARDRLYEARNNFPVGNIGQGMGSVDKDALATRTDVDARVMQERQKESMQRGKQSVSSREMAQIQNKVDDLKAKKEGLKTELYNLK